MLLQIGHSPDPDDAFMFYALSHGMIDTGDLQFTHVLRDIQTLNEWAMSGRLEITAISVHAFAYVHDRYALLPNGASIGDGYGPIVVARDDLTLLDLEGQRIAVPGLMTTAYLTLKLALPAFEVVVTPFDAIMDVVSRGEVPAGLLIHEGQLTYNQLGLHKVADLGEWWGHLTGLPLPLGCNVVRHDLSEELMARVSRILADSIRYGLKHRQEALTYALQHGRGLSTEQGDTFVGMYVNDYTLHYGERGRQAVETLLRLGHEAGLLPKPVALRFVE